METGGRETPGDDIRGSAGLFLYVGAIIAMAVWLSMINDPPRGGVAAIAGMATAGLFAAALCCFALGRPEPRCVTDTRPAGEADRIRQLDR